MTNLDQLNDMYIDVLREIGNIGTGNATTAISNMLNLKMDMGVPKVELLPVEKLGEAIGSEEEIVVGIMLGVEADIDGSMMFIMDMKSAHKMVNLLMMRDPEDDREFDEMDLSALREIGNIIAGSYLSAISTLTNLVISPTVPSVSIDMAAAILSVPAVQFGLISDRALMIKTAIGGDVSIDGYFILIPDEESFAKILSSLGISFE
jgi:chemotaxis protein CheC